MALKDVELSDINLEEVNFRIFFNTRLYLILSVAIGLIGAAVVMFVVIPQAQEAYNVYQELESEKPTLARLEQKADSLRSITQTPEFGQIETVNSALPSKKPLLELLTAVNAVSRTTQVGIDAFELSPGLIASDGAELEQASGPYSQLEVDMTISGNFEQIQEFVFELEQTSPFTEVTELQISDSRATSFDTPVVRAEITSQTYYFTQPIRVTVDQPLPSISSVEQDILNQLAQFEVISVPEQLNITGGGLEDLFGVDNLFLNQADQSDLEQELDQ